MSEGRFRGRQRQAYRSPLFLAFIAVALGALGYAQLGTPLAGGPPPTQIALASATSRATLTEIPPTPTRANTNTPLPTNTHTATRAPAKTRAPTFKPSPTLTPLPTATDTPLATETLEITNTPSPLARSLRVPILMYHHVGELPPDADAIRKSLTVSQANFEAQIKFLSDQGYKTLRISELVAALQSGAPLPDKPIILTFDDGYDDNYTNVFPTLKDFGFGGTFFVIGAPTDYGSPGYLRWEQILEMYEYGMEIGSHALTHRYNLGTTRNSTQDAEIKGAYKLMVDHLPNWTPIFSYPSGSYNQYSLDLLAQLGYIAAVTTRQGTLHSSTDPLELRRIRIRGEWNMEQFLYWFNYWTAKR